MIYIFGFYGEYNGSYVVTIYVVGTIACFAYQPVTIEDKTILFPDTAHIPYVWNNHVIYKFIEAYENSLLSYDNILSVAKIQEELTYR